MEEKKRALYIKGLNAKQRQAIALQAQGLTQGEIAQQTDINLRTLNKWQHKPAFILALQAATEKASKENVIPKGGTPEDVDADAWTTLRNAIKRDGRLAFDYLRAREALSNAPKTGVTKFKVTFGTIPNDAPPLPVQLPSKVIQMKQENA